jgi:hypothetical protein
MAVKTVYPEPELDPFNDFSTAEIFAYTYKFLGASAFSSGFSGLDAELKRQYGTQLWREALVDAADQLSMLNLGKCADIVMAEAEKRPSKFDRPNEWFATEEKHWRACQERKREEWEAKRKSNALRLNGVRTNVKTLTPLTGK